MLGGHPPEFRKQSAAAGDDDAGHFELIDDLQRFLPTLGIQTAQVLHLQVAEDLHEAKGEDLDKPGQSQAWTVHVTAIDRALDSLLAGDQAQAKPAAVDLEQCLDHQPVVGASCLVALRRWFLHGRSVLNLSQGRRRHRFLRGCVRMSRSALPRSVHHRQLRECNSLVRADASSPGTGNPP